jgi:hypothetical protein
VNDIFPFFLGCGRSGTTLLRAMFDSHPEMAVPAESNFISSMGSTRSAYEGSQSLNVDRFTDDLFGKHGWGFRRWGLPLDEVRKALSQRHLHTFADGIRCVYMLYAEKHGKSRYGDKTTHYISLIAQLAQLLPEARFVHIVRDGRDVALALLESPWGFETIPQAAVYWAGSVESGRRAGRWLGAERYCEVPYEDLVTKPDETLQLLCDFIHLKFDGAMLRYFERADEIIAQCESPEHHQRLFLPPTKGLRDWRTQMSASDAAVFDVIAGDLLADLGYEIA